MDVAGSDLSGYVKLGPTTVQSTTAAYAIQVKTTHASGVGISVESDSSNGVAIYGKNNGTVGTSDYVMSIKGG